MRPIPSTIGRYVLLRRLVTVAASDSYVAADAEVGLLDLHLLPADETSRDAVLALAQLAHPNMARFRDAGIADDDIYLVEDHIDGVSLADLRRVEPLPGDVTLHLGAALASTLAEVELNASSSADLCARVPALDEIFVSLVGQIKVSLTSVIKLPSFAENMVELEAAGGSGARPRPVAAPSPSPAERRPPSLGLAHGVGQIITQLLGPVEADEDSASQAARAVALAATVEGGLLGGCRALHSLAVAALRQASTGPSGGFVSGKLSDLAEDFITRRQLNDGRTLLEIEAELQHEAAHLIAALPEGTPQAAAVQSWYHGLQPVLPPRRERSAPAASVPAARPEAVKAAQSVAVPRGPMPAVGTHVLGTNLTGTPYKLLRKLGAGGMGLVFEAEHVDLGRRVAIKVLHGTLNRDPQVLARFKQEARSAARIRHPNIVEIYDFGTTSVGEVFLVMELLKGKSLSRLFRMYESGQVAESGAAGHKGMPLHRALDIVCQACDAVEAAHQAGVTHRDLKPDNVMVMPRGKGDPPGSELLVKVLDFGIAKLREPGPGGESLQSITRQGQLFGTPEYMAPEQILGGKADHRVDIYALGCITYELLTGVLPFAGDGYGQMLAAHLREAPVRLRQRAPDREIPPELEAVVLRAMAKEPGERFASMADLQTALLAVNQRLALPLAPMPALLSGPIGSPTHPPVASGPSTPPPARPTPPGSELAAAARVSGAAAQAPPALTDSAVTPLLPAPVLPAAAAPRLARAPRSQRGRRATPVALLWGGAGFIVGLVGLGIWFEVTRPEPSGAASGRVADPPAAVAVVAPPAPPPAAPPAATQDTPHVLEPAADPLAAYGPPVEPYPSAVAARLAKGPPIPPLHATPAEIFEEPSGRSGGRAHAAAGTRAMPKVPLPITRDPAEEPAVSPPDVVTPAAPVEAASPRPAAPAPSEAPTEVVRPAAPREPAAVAAVVTPRVVSTPPPVVPSPPPPRFSSGRVGYNIIATTSAYGRRDAAAGIERQLPNLTSCYQRAVRENPSAPPRGVGLLSFAVTEDGAATGARLILQAGAPAALRRCLEQSLSDARFPQPEIGPAQVTVQLQLDPVP